MSEHFGRIDGYVFVNQDQIRCSGDVYKALVASGYGKKSDWRHPAGHDEYVSEVMKCQSKTKWKAYQITFTIKDGEIEFTYCSRVNGHYGDAFAKAIGGTYKEINMGDEEGKFQKSLSLDAVAGFYALRPVVLDFVHVCDQIGPGNESIRRITACHDELCAFCLGIDQSQSLFITYETEVHSYEEFVQDHYIVGSGT